VALLGDDQQNSLKNIGHNVLAYQMWLKHVLPYSGFNPRWDCTFKFQLHVPELVLVRFMAEDHDYATSNDFLGQFTLPFTSMRTGMTFINFLLNQTVLFWLPTLNICSAGYRHVHLLKADGSSMSPSSLFIHVKITPGYSSPTRQAGTPSTWE